jgi:hypothetical protein
LSLALSPLIYEWRRYRRVPARQEDQDSILAINSAGATVDQSQSQLVLTEVNLRIASDERVVEVVVSADNARFLIGQRVMVKFMKAKKTMWR